MKWLKNYKYKGLTLIALSILLTIILSKYNFLNQILFNVRHVPFLGSFLAGILYVSTSTAILGILIILDLSKTLSPIQIAVIAGIGATFADFVLFRFLKDDVLSELTPIYNKLGGKHLTELMHHKYLRWSLPIVGAIIIASPLPDEIGISLMGLTKIKSYQFVVLSLILNIIGVFLLVSTFLLLKQS